MASCATMEMLTQKPTLPRLPAGAGRDRPLVDFFVEANKTSFSHGVRDPPRDNSVVGHVNVSPNRKSSPAKARKNKAPAKKYKSPVKAAAPNPLPVKGTAAGGLAYHSHAPNLQSIPPPLELLVRK